MNQEQIMQQLRKALQAHQDKDLDTAETIFKKILAVNPKESNALHLLGCIYKDRGQLKEAIDLIKASIRENDSNPIPYLNLGKILVEAGQHEDAAVIFQESLKRSPQISETWFCFGNALRVIEKVQEAKQAYRNAIRLNYAHVGAASNLGALLTDDCEWDEAEELFSKAIEYESEDVNLRVNYGKLLAEKGDYSAAIVQYRIALSLAPRSPELHYNFANSLKEAGEFEEAIENYRKAIKLKPDFAGAFFALGLALNIEGEIEEVRMIISALYDMKPIDKDFLISFGGKCLIFDWHFRQTFNLSWNNYLASYCRQKSITCFEAVKRVDALCFPLSFLGDDISCDEAKPLCKNGYLVEENLVSPDLCAQLIGQFRGGGLMSSELIESVAVHGILRSLLVQIFRHTGFPHLIWNCIYFARGPDDESVSHAWHYDNHYNVWTPKLMIYLNSQQREGGATDFVDATLSANISEKSGYMGILWQRKFYKDHVKGFVKDLNLDPDTLDPSYFTFSPDLPGTGVWFFPARSLHRGVSPKKGIRHVLSFSLTPLPLDCGWSIDQCADRSIIVLQDKVTNGMQATDVNPYWVFDKVGYI